MESFKMATQIYSGSGAVDNIRRYDIQQALIVCDPYVEKTNKLDSLIRLFEQEKTSYAVFSKVVPDPTIDVITCGTAQAIAAEPDAIVAVGGGSALDTAKAIRYIYQKAIQEKNIQLICIPTTSGTGSEVTSFAVISDPQYNKKFALVDDSMIPDAAILDADFTLSMPKSLTADTGMDVLTHTLEAYVSTQATDFTDACAEKAMRIILDNLGDVVKDGSNQPLRTTIHNASCLAGMAFSEASLGICHSLAHALGGRFHIPHGRANAMLLPQVIAYNAGLDSPKELPGLVKYQQAANLLGIQSGTAKATVNLLIVRIKRLIDQLEIPKMIHELDIDEETFIKAIPEMAEAAMQDTCTLTNPRKPAMKDLERLYKSICRSSTLS